MTQLLVTIIGQDRTGLVERLSDTVYQNHGNWLQSSLSQLSGQFAGIIQLEIEPHHIMQLSQALSQIDELQIHIVEAQSQKTVSFDNYLLQVTGNDRPGIIKEVTAHLTQLGINIIKLTSQTQSAPNWGYPIFSANFELELPNALTIGDVQAHLEQLSDDLTIDLLTADEIATV
ncbi:TPA: glycine cleavage system protein R [Photobacterium damselae]